jgi:CheY-like chemotaxis protein
MDSISSIRNIMVLVVDDNRISRRFTVAALREIAGSVKQACSGGEAIDTALMVLPSVIFMDVHLQDMSGIEALRQIRSRWPKRCARPRVVLVTADDKAGSDHELNAAGIDQLLLKPASAERLQAALRDGKSLGSQQIPQREPAALTLRPMFLAELRARIPELDENIAGLEWSAAGELMHQLIASSAICGEKRLERSSRDLYGVLTGEVRADELAMSYYEFLMAAGGLTHTSEDLKLR